MRRYSLLTGAATALLVVSCCAATASFAKTAATHPAADRPKDVFAHLKFRNLGPAIAGGRVAAVAGVPGDPLVYYVGAGGGGVFKTTDGGLNWKPIFAHEETSSIGAIAVAASNPSIVWVGTGEANIRNDVLPGAGAYLSTDAGKTWRMMGLRNVGQIGRIVIDPHNPDHVVVAAQGHAWGPNPDRGVFVTTDGGKSWRKSLYVDDHTGAIDVVMQPNNGQVLLAATWQADRRAWTLDDGGPGSGVWRSTDGGETWKRLRDGLPTATIGRIGLAIAPSDPDRVYALLEAPMGKGSLFVTNDLGDHWQQVSDNHAYNVRGFYFTTLEVAPNDPRRVYFLGFQLAESDDGGRTAHVIDESVHVDHHAMWIDPTNPKRMIQGNDGGAYLSLDGGGSWRFLDGMAIEQTYMVAADSRTPYTLCTGLQDNSGWCGPSSVLYDNVVSGQDWFTVAGGDGQYAVPTSNPNIIYADSQDGAIRRLDLKTHESVSGLPYLHGPAYVDDIPTYEQKIRFNWTSPIAVDPRDVNTVYLGGSVLLKSTDGAHTWKTISPDLTRNDKSKQQLPGGPIHYDISGAETYDTIISIQVAQSDPNVIWVGSDDGLVSVTRDGGSTWSKVTPPRAPEWARVYQIDVSQSDPGTAYVAFDAHQSNDNKPYAYATTNYGHSWRAISGGLPADGSVMVVRADPDDSQVLVAGTMRGVWVSRDGGDRWTQLDSNLPTMPVFDLKFVRGDLVLATHGRGLWVLDHFAPVAQLHPDAVPEQVKLFTPPRDGTEFRRWQRGEGAEPSFVTPNAPEGVVIDYSLPKKLDANKQQKALHQTPVKIEIRDASGELIATRYGEAQYGVNRFVWDMRYDMPTSLEFEKPSLVGKAPEFERRGGPEVLPGTYSISVTADGHTETANAQVMGDPNDPPAIATQKQSLQLALETRAQVDALNRMLNHITTMQSELMDYRKNVAAEANSIDASERALAKSQAAVVASGEALGKELGKLKDSVYDPNVQHTASEDSIHELADLQGSLERNAGGFARLDDQAPSAPMLTISDELKGKLTAKLAAYNSLLAGDVAAYNQAAYAAGAPTLAAGKPIRVADAPEVH